MKFKVFVDGQEGTTGLQINERLEARTDIEILKIAPEKRKDLDERKKFMNNADIAFLCLPDAAAKESVSLIENNTTRVIDASTAHRTDPNWAYGMPELSRDHRNRIKTAMRVSVPGCYATGFNMAIYPLVKEGILPSDYPVTCHAISGYSGGGKKLIEKYQAPDADNTLMSPQLYALGLSHKHLPEMQKISGLQNPPVFSPIVSNIYKGMTVALPLLPRLLLKKMGAKEAQAFLSDYYKDEAFVEVMPFGAEATFDNGFLGAEGCNDTNKLEIYVFGHNDQILLVSRLDNLGKGSSGAAIQNMNIMLGLNERIGLE
ncbi:MAG: N-acetyl-gamma-glutamyl-phosphate reductase [Clostridia bacterium]|nr:N-acetyl-gamma-glutamyl-phosphate reductase [Clostridia bacterium]